MSVSVSLSHSVSLIFSLVSVFPHLEITSVADWMWNSKTSSSSFSSPSSFPLSHILFPFRFFPSFLLFFLPHPFQLVCLPCDSFFFLVLATFSVSTFPSFFSSTLSLSPLVSLICFSSLPTSVSLPFLLRLLLLYLYSSSFLSFFTCSCFSSPSSPPPSFLLFYLLRLPPCLFCFVVSGFQHQTVTVLCVQCRCDHSFNGPPDHDVYLCAGVITAMAVHQTMAVCCLCAGVITSLAVHQTMTVLYAQVWSCFVCAGVITALAVHQTMTVCCLCAGVITVSVVHQTMTVCCVCAGVITALAVHQTMSFVCAGVIMFCGCRCDHSLGCPPDHDCMLSVCRCDHSLSSPPDHDLCAQVWSCSVYAGVITAFAVHQTMTVLCAQVWSCCVCAGVITALAVHQTQSWMTVGTTTGNHNVWDMRFMLSIAAPNICHKASKCRCPWLGQGGVGLVTSVCQCLDEEGIELATSRCQCSDEDGIGVGYIQMSVFRWRWHWGWLHPGVSVQMKMALGLATSRCQCLDEDGVQLATSRCLCLDEDGVGLATSRCQCSDENGVGLVTSRCQCLDEGDAEMFTSKLPPNVCLSFHSSACSVSEKRVHRIVMHPQKQSWFASAVNWNNEVSMWNVESMMRQEMLWASPYPPSFTGSEVRQSGYWNHDSCDPPPTPRTPTSFPHSNSSRWRTNQ